MRLLFVGIFPTRTSNYFYMHKAIIIIEGLVLTTLEQYEHRLVAKCKESGHDFFKAFVLTYLRQGITPPPIDLHGRGEKGKDIFFCHCLPLGFGELHCVVMIHMDKIDSKIGSKTSVQRVIEQAEKAFEFSVDVGDYEGESIKHADVVIVITPFKINEDAKGEIRKKVELGTRNILFKSGSELISIIHQHNKEILEEMLKGE